jgi:hypothetical protein
MGLERKDLDQVFRQAALPMDLGFPLALACRLGPHLSCSEKCVNPKKLQRRWVVSANK